MSYDLRSKFTAAEQAAGEKACRNLSELAESVRCNSDIYVYEIENDEGETLYCIRGIVDRDDMSFEDLDEILCSFAEVGDTF